MGRVEQIYCTHCTPETSVFGRFAGFSTRAGSLEPEALRVAYDVTFRVLSAYQLPEGMPLDEVVRATADSAPVRLVFHPSAGGYQALGQVCYRPAAADGPGGVGSLFGHFVFNRPEGAEGAWTARDALRFWGARGWVRADAPEIPRRLPALDSLDELLRGSEPAVGEGVFESFLTAPPGGPFRDPAGVIPDRWRAAPRAERQGLFEELLDGALTSDQNFGQPGAVVLVAEPGFAALLFFGLARVLPATFFGRALSVSTYEWGRPVTALAATVPGAPARAGPAFEPPACREAGFVLDTLATPAWRRPARQGEARSYARLACETLASGGGSAALDGLLAGFEGAGVRHSAELHEMAELREALPTLFDPNARPFGAVWKPGSPPHRYAAAALREVVRGRVADPDALRALALSPNAATLLAVLTRAEPDPELAPALDAITSALSPQALAVLLNWPDVPRRTRVMALLGHLAREGRWPEPLEATIYDETAGRPGPEGGPLRDVLPDVLDRLQPAWLPGLVRHAPDDARVEFLQAVAARLAHQPEARAVLLDLVEGLDDDGYCRLLSAEGGEVVRLYRHDPGRLQARADNLLRSLPDRPRQFPARLDALGRVTGSLRPDQAERVRAWEAVRRSVLQAARGEPRRRPLDLASFFRGRSSAPPAPDPFHGLAATLRLAMPDVDDPARRLAVLLRVIDEGLFPRGGFPPEARAAVARAVAEPGSS
jgi:hypothetical protein